MFSLRKRTKAFSIALACMCTSFISGVAVSFASASSNEQETSSYVELYSPLNNVAVSTTDDNFLSVSVKNNIKTESGKALTLSYTPGNTTAVFATIPMTVTKATDDFEGLAFWVDVPRNEDEYSFTMHVVKSENTWQHMLKGYTLTLIDEDGDVTEQTTESKHLYLNGFTGWVMIPEYAYENAVPMMNEAYNIVIEMGNNRTEAIKLSLGSFGYYTDYNKFLAEKSNTEGFRKQILKQIDGYISEIDALTPKTDRQVKLRNKMLVYFSNLKENFNLLSSDDCVEISNNLYNEYVTYMEDYSYGEIRQTNFVMSFAVMSDPHVSNTWFNPYMLNALEDVKSIDPNLSNIFVLGDLSDNGVSPTTEALTGLDDYYNWIDAYEKKEGVTFRNILGNHDVRGPAVEPGGAHPVESYDVAVEMYLEREGVETLQWDTWINGYHFVFVNPDRHHGDYCYLSAETINWLDETLAENEDGRPIFVMIHQPLTLVYTMDGASMSFEEVIARHPSAIVSSGHTHAAFSSNQIIQEGKGTYINQGTMMYAQAEYYYVEVYEGGVIYRARQTSTDTWVMQKDVIISNEDKSSNLLFSADLFDSSSLQNANVSTSVVKADTVSGRTLKLVGTTGKETVSIPAYAMGNVDNYAGYALYIESQTTVKVGFAGVSLKENAKYYSLQANGLIEKTVGANGEIIADGWVIIPKAALNDNSAPSKTLTLDITVDTAQSVNLDKVCYYFDVEDFVNSVSNLSCVYYNNDGSVVQSSLLKLGDTVNVPMNPTKNATAEHTFTFIGWDIDADGVVDELPNTIKGNISAKAVYTATIREYTYTFYGADGTTVFFTDTVDYGTEIVAPDVDNLFGWDLDGDGAIEGLPKTLQGEMNAVAIIESSTDVLNYTFKDVNGYIYKSGQVLANESIIIPSNPILNKENTYFIGWDLDGDGFVDTLPENGIITEDFNATAVFYQLDAFETLNAGVKSGWSNPGNTIGLTNVTYESAPTGTAVSVNLNKNSLTSGDMYLTYTLPYDKQPTGLALWMDISTMSSFSMRIWKNWIPKYQTSHGGGFMYFYHDDGTVTKAEAWRKAVIPENFKGWMILPMYLFTDNTTILMGDILRLGFPINEDGNVNLKGQFYFGEFVRFNCSVEQFIDQINKKAYKLNDYDGSTLSVGIVGKGQTSLTLTDPVRDGWEFVGWDTNGDGIAEAITEVSGRTFTATAVYTKNFTYKFVDENNNVILEKTAAYNSLVLSPFRYLYDDPNYANIVFDYGIYEEGMRLTEDVTFVVTAEGRTTPPQENNPSDSSTGNNENNPSDTGTDNSGNGSQNDNQGSDMNLGGGSGCNSSLMSGATLTVLMMLAIGLMIIFSKKIEKNNQK